MSSTPEAAPSTNSPLAKRTKARPIAERDEVAREKAKQHRRAQVRRAQIAHRQQKADHIKRLEHDVIRYREWIAIHERETELIKRENEVLKARLEEASLSLQARGPSTRATGSAPKSLGSDDATLEDDEVMRYALEDGVVNDVTVTMSLDYTMGTPCLNVRSNSSATSTQSLPGLSSDSGTERSRQLSPEQEIAAVNFILSMEHLCWEHFEAGDFPSSTSQDEEVRGHALMASTPFLALAPESFFITSLPLFTDYMKTHQIQETPRLATVLSPPPATHQPPPTYEWQAMSVSLADLRVMAERLFPADKEITPVQAWFELEGRYGAERLLEREVQNVLKVELRGVVDCLHFGAVMDREAFESVVGRVLGTPV